MSRAATHRAAVAVVAAGLLLTVLTPVAAGDEISDLDRARQELDDANRDLDDLRDRIQRTDAEVAALDVALLEATTDLAELQDELADASELHERRVAEQAEATDALLAADAALEAEVASWNADRDQLADRARHAYVHGRTSEPELLLRGVRGADDWHEVAVTFETVGRIAADDAELVERSGASTRSTAQLRAEVADARRAALEASQAAATQARHVAGLEAEAAATVEDVEQTRQDRTDALASLEADEHARAMLVDDLEAQVAELELSAETVLVPVVVDLDPYGPPPAWAVGLSEDGQRWAAAIEATAARHGIDGRLLAALVWTESGFRPDAVSSAGALGLAQLMPGTARGLGVDPADPLANLDGGARYLRTQLDAFGRVDLALAAYNAGPGRVDGRVPDIVETQLYVRRVLERYERLRG